MFLVGPAGGAHDGPWAGSWPSTPEAVELRVFAAIGPGRPMPRRRASRLLRWKPGTPMLKIAVAESSDQAVTMRLEGRVIGPWVAELGRSCDRVLEQDGRLILDLAHVSFIDRDGIALVRSLRDRGATLRGCSPFVAEQLRDVLRKVSRS